MSMFKKIAVTNRSLCSEKLDKQVSKICKDGLCDMVILREKDLSEDEYLKLAMNVKNICDKHGVAFACNGMSGAAKALGTVLQLSYRSFLSYKPEKVEKIWVSVHSLEEAVNAERLGAECLIAGHIFMTDCKKGLEPRGTEFLKEVCKAVDIPVFAIGGINDDNTEIVKNAGAQGECRMSWYMQY